MERRRLLRLPEQVFSGLLAPGPVHRPLIPSWVAKRVLLSLCVCVLCGDAFAL